MKRFYLMKDHSACVFHDERLAVLWSVTVDERGYLNDVVPLCPECAEGYKDLMRKTYGEARRFFPDEKRVVE